MVSIQGVVLISVQANIHDCACMCSLSNSEHVAHLVTDSPTVNLLTCGCAHSLVDIVWLKLDSCLATC